MFRIPGGINRVAQYRITLHVHLLDLAITCKERSAHIPSHMKQHGGSVIILIIVTVDAMILPGMISSVILIDGLHIECRQIALIQPELSIELITRFNQTVRQISIDGFCNAQRITFECHPTSIATSINRHFNLSVTRRLKQLAPLQRVDRYFTVFGATGNQFGTFSTFHCNDKFIARITHHKIERSYVFGNHNIGVVWINQQLFRRRR